MASVGKRSLARVSEVDPLQHRDPPSGTANTRPEHVRASLAQLA